MNIGELFVSLGIKGSEKTLGALTGMRKGLSETASASLTTKAALVGVFYAMERLFSGSAKSGNMLTNFKALTGMGGELVQQYQYVANEVGISNEEMASSFKNLQDKMTETLTNKGAPSGMARVFELTPEFGKFDANDYSKNPEKLFQRLLAYARKEKDKGFRNQNLSSFGIGEGLQGAMARPDSFKPEAIKNAPKLADAELQKLDHVYKLWSDIENKIKLAFGHFNAKHGEKLSKDMDGLVEKITGVAESFVKLADSLKLFEHIGQIFEGWTAIFEALRVVVDKINDTQSPDKKKAEGAKVDVETATYDIGNVLTEAINSVKGAVESFADDVSTGAGHEVKRAVRDNTPRKSAHGEVGYQPSGAEPPRAVPAGAKAPSAPTLQGLPKVAAPKAGVPKLYAVPPISKNPQVIAPKVAPVPAAAKPGTNVKVDVHQVFQHDGRDTGKVRDAHKEAVGKAYRQFPGQNQGS